LLSQDEIDSLRFRNNSFLAAPLSSSSARSHTPGQYSPETESGYVVRGSGVCVSRLALDQHKTLSKQCCKQVFFPHSHRHIANDWSEPSSSSSSAGEGFSSESLDLTNTCYFLPLLVNHSSASSSHQSPPALYCMSARDVQTPYNSSSSSSSSSVYPPSAHHTHQRMKAVRCQSQIHCTVSGSQCLSPLTSYPTALITIGLLSPFIPLATSSSTSTLYHYHEVIYEGTPHELLQTLSVGSYRLRHWLNILSDLTGIHDGYSSQSSLYLLLNRLPDTLTLYLWLCIQLNISVALLNMLPVSILDGGMTSPQFARLIFPKSWAQISKVTEYYGVILLAGNLLIGLMLPLLAKSPQPY
jgi:hypothetical protein